MYISVRIRNQLKLGRQNALSTLRSVCCSATAPHQGTWVSVTTRVQLQGVYRAYNRAYAWLIYQVHTQQGAYTATPRPFRDQSSSRSATGSDWQRVCSWLQWLQRALKACTRLQRQNPSILVWRTEPTKRSARICLGMPSNIESCRHLGRICI